MKVSVSITKVKTNRKDAIIELNNTNCDYLHVDTMDGKFVLTNQLEYDEFYELSKYNKKPLDVHLMVEDPVGEILKFKRLFPEIITIHYEINKNIDDLIDLIHSYNIKAGISIKPNTSVIEISKYLSKIDNVLIMSVEPGLGGQKFMDSVIPKIDELKKLREDNNYKYTISIDGGINGDSINKVKDVDIVISGSFICMSDNYQEKIDSLKGVIR